MITNSSELALMVTTTHRGPWIQRSLEDIEATITGLSEVTRRRSAASQNPASSSPGNLVP